MPRHKKNVTRRPRGRRGKKSLRKKAQIPRGNISSELKAHFTWLPRKRRCVLPVTQKFFLTSSATTNVFGSEYIFRLNSIYAPLLAPAAVTDAHRVLGYTSIAAEYQRYIVHAVDIQIEFSDPTADGMAVGVAVQASSNGQTLTALPIADADLRDGYWTSCINNTGAQKKYFKQYLPLYKLEGCSKTAFQVNETNYASNIGGSPTLTPYLRIACCDLRGVSQPTIECIVRLKYYTVLYDKLNDNAPTYTS